MLVEWSEIHGVFGIDAIMRDGVPWLVEVNPRYTAAVEVVERVFDMRLAFRRFAGGRAISESAVGVRPTRLRLVRRRNNETLAKAIYYAAQSSMFPASGPWRDRPGDFADIPRAGTRIAAVSPCSRSLAATSRNCAAKRPSWIRCSVGNSAMTLNEQALVVADELADNADEFRVAVHSVAAHG